MFDEIDRAYYARRAAEEHSRADAARDIAVERPHRTLAAAYEHRARLATAPEIG